MQETMLGFYKKSNCRLSNNCQQGNGILEVDCDKYVRIEQLAIDRRFANKNGFELITIGNKVRRRFLGVGERSEFRPVCIASLLRWPTRGRHRSRNIRRQLCQLLRHINKKRRRSGLPQLPKECLHFHRAKPR